MHWSDRLGRGSTRTERRSRWSVLTPCLTMATGASLALPGTMASAALYNYGDFPANTVDYLGVSEDTRELTIPLFGSPSVVGDTLDFDPTNFSSESSGLEADIVDAQLNLTIMARPGFTIPSVSISERGDFTLNGLAGEASATVAAPIFIEVVEIDGVALDKPIDFAGSMIFTSGGDFLLSEEGIGTGQFEGLAMFDLDALLAAEGVTGSATKVKVAMDNTLSTASVPGTAAFIAKKDFDSVAVTVPEPASLGLVAAGAVLVLRRRRG